MAWGQSIATTLGGAGNDVDRAANENIGIALSVIQQKLMAQEVQQRLAEQQQKMKQQGMPSPQGTYQAPGGIVGTTFDANTGKYGGGLIPGTEAAGTGAASPTAIPSALSPEKVKALIDRVPEQSRPFVDAAVNGYIQRGEPDKALAILGQILGKEVTAALKPPTGTGSILGTIMKAQSGGPGANEAAAALKTYVGMQTGLKVAGAQAYGQARAQYQIQAYVDPATGQLVPMSNMDAIKAIHAGQNLIPSGRLPANLEMSTQQLVSEAAPALKEVRSHLSTFDNPKDRAIFARVMANNAAAGPGQEQQWLGTVLNQALQGGLSEDGRQMVVRLNRLNESVGRLRAVLGLPATERMVAMTLAMVPGPTTPDSRMAKDILDNLESTITNAVSVPMLGRGTAAPSPSGGGIKNRVIDLTQ